jgi:hypothetical protein
MTVTILREAWKQQLTAWVVLLVILGATLPIRAEEEIRILTDARVEVEARRHVHARLSVELIDGTPLRDGGRCSKERLC